MAIEKQIEEMTKHCFYNEEGNCCVDLHKSTMCEDEAKTCAMYQTIENIYNAGYRKKNDVAKEIFDTIKEKLIFNAYGIATISSKTFCELKKKYTGEKEDEQVY